jgi:hypothetical protein
MKILLSPVFLVCCLLFVAHQVARFVLDVYIPLVSDYADPLLAIPIILTLLLWERVHLFRWKGYTRLSSLEVIGATLLVICIAELVFPYFSNEFTADPLDVVFFLAGAALFYFTINPKPVAK